MGSKEDRSREQRKQLPWCSFEELGTRVGNWIWGKRGRRDLQAAYSVGGKGRKGRHNMCSAVELGMRLDGLDLQAKES